jgi:glycerophosphoryl diester phosphodiesterase
VEFAGTAALLAVAELNFRQFSQFALEQNFAGVSGHYLLLSRKIIRYHHQNKQKIGTGFVASRFCFYRELNRGVDWIFTNHALKLRAIQQSLLRNS